MGFRVQGFEVGVLGFKVEVEGLGVWGFGGLGVGGLGFRV